MLRIKVELVPFGNESMARQVASMIIANDGSGDLEWGNYVYAYKDNIEQEPVSGTIKNHYRLMGVWPLIKRALISSNEYEDEDKELVDLVVERLNADL